MGDKSINNEAYIFNYTDTTDCIRDYRSDIVCERFTVNEELFKNRVGDSVLMLKQHIVAVIVSRHLNTILLVQQVDCWTGVFCGIASNQPEN